MRQLIHKFRKKNIINKKNLSNPIPNRAPQAMPTRPLGEGPQHIKALKKKKKNLIGPKKKLKKFKDQNFFNKAQKKKFVIKI
jgi:hypothetical protein